MASRRGNYDPGNPKEGASSGIVKTSSTVSDQGPLTTRATPEGESIVDADGEKNPDRRPIGNRQIKR